jgi:hypothetical protein
VKEEEKDEKEEDEEREGRRGNYSICEFIAEALFQRFYKRSAHHRIVLSY